MWGASLLGLIMCDSESRALKPHLNFEQQLQRLKARGLQVTDDALALNHIERLGYCRISGYFYPMRKTKPYGEKGRLDQFEDGASLDLVIRLAEFDKQLRLIVLNSLETIEIAVRVAVAHRLGKLNAEAHLLSRFLDKPMQLN